MILFVFDTDEERDKFIYLYDKYKKTTIYTIRLFITDEFTSEDLMQEIYLIIAKNLHKIDETDEKRTRNYIITIARNYCKSYIRKKARSKEDFMEEIVDYHSFSPNSDYNDILEVLLRKESYQLLVDEVKQLDDKYKIALELKYVTDLDDAQIAQIMHTTKKNIQMRIYRAKLMLRQKLEDLNVQEYY